MEEADEIILITIRDLGCELEEEKSLKQFDADIVYKCVLVYLKAINNDKVSNLTATIPKNMSARVNACSTMATVIRELGYRAELSYHNLLYPNVNDIRKIFIFLGQNLPKKESLSTGHGGDQVKLDTLICNYLEKSIKESWMPYFCPFSKRIPGNYSTARLFTTTPVKIPSRGRQVKVTPGLESYYSMILPQLTLQPNRTDDIAPSVFEYNLSLYGEKEEKERDWNAKGVSSGLNPMDYAKQKQKSVTSRMQDSLRAAVIDGEQGGSRRSAANGSLEQVIAGFSGNMGLEEDMNEFSRKMMFTTEGETNTTAATPTSTKETEEERAEKHRAELDQLQQSLQEISDQTSLHNSKMEEYIAMIRQLEALMAEEDRKRMELEQVYKLKKRTFALLEDGDENIKKLQQLCQQSSAALIEMSNEWERVRKPIIEKYRSLRDEKANQNDEAKSKLERIKEMRVLIKKLIAEIRTKEDLFQQLQDAYKSAPKDTNRSMYTRRILDTVKNIKKQKVDIDKVLLDTKSLQKEINTITDAAVRAFESVKDMLYADAKKDATAKQAIKSFAVIDEKFQALLGTIDETGQTQNNILNLSSKIDHITQKTNTLNTDRVLTDLKNIKLENQNLIKTIKSKIANPNE